MQNSYLKKLRKYLQGNCASTADTFNSCFKFADILKIATFLLKQTLRLQFLCSTGFNSYAIIKQVWIVKWINKITDLKAWGIRAKSWSAL